MSSPPQAFTLEQLPKLLQSLDPAPQALIIDEEVQRIYGSQLAALAHNPELSVWAVAAGEELKTLPSYAAYAERISTAANLHRRGPLVVVGGGTVMDFGGFLAATLLRGIPWIAVPTTYLAMIDAAIGGKVGLNTPAGKNLVGAFHNPDKIWIFKEFLASYCTASQLKNQLKDELGELIKYALLHPPIAEKLQAGYEPEDLIMDCALFKHRIVQKDPRENHPSALRTHLNLGHTWAHSLETLYGLPHGRAVYHGLLWEGLMQEGERESEQSRLTLQLGRILELPCFLTPTTLARYTHLTWDVDAFLATALKDKKRAPEADFILLRYLAPHRIETFSLSYQQARSGLLSLESKLEQLKG